MSLRSSTIPLIVLSSILVITLLGLGAYTYKDYRQDQLEEKELAIQKKAMMAELSAMVTKYENVQALNGAIDGHLIDAKKRIVRLLDTVRMNEPKLRLLLKFRSDIELLKDEKEKLFRINDSLIYENNQMKKNLDEQDLVISKKDLKLNKSENLKKILINENKKLLSLVSDSKKITFSSLKARALRIKKNRKIVGTNKIKKTDVIKACFRMKENIYSKNDSKNIFIKIKNPKGELLGDTIGIKFNNEIISYSAEKEVFYSKEEIKVCFSVKPDEDKLIPGKYRFELFEEHLLKGTSTFKLE